VSEAVLGVDPGSAKAGYALVAGDGSIVCAGIAAVETLPETLAALIAEHSVACLAVGKGTRSGAVTAALSRLGVPMVLVDEFETTRRARALYFEEHPPRGWRRLIPVGMQLPPRPIDDYAAVLIARNYLRTRAEQAGVAN
jgi:RNase H-fold protein (predicted Holliday junction resolvase)